MPPSDYPSYAAFLAVDLLEQWGVMSKAAKKVAADAVDAGFAREVMLIVKQCEINHLIERWLQSGEGKKFLEEHPKE